MYISTNHSVGDTVYWYSPINDTVVRAMVQQISYVKSATLDEVRYTLAVRGTDEAIHCDADSLYSRPESAFYNNLPPTELKPAADNTET